MELVGPYLLVFDVGGNLGYRCLLSWFSTIWPSSRDKKCRGGNRLSRIGRILKLVSLLGWIPILIISCAKGGQGVPATEQTKETSSMTATSEITSICSVTPQEQLFRGPIRFVRIPRRWVAGGAGKPVLELMWEGENPPTKLEIRGHRLDGDAPSFSREQILSLNRFAAPKTASLATDFEIPAPGCWEIEVRASENILRFVAEVYPRTYQQVALRDDRLFSLEDAVRNSDGILLAQVESSASDRPGFIWRTVRVLEVWKAPTPVSRKTPIEVGQRLDLLQVDEEKDYWKKGYYNFYEAPLFTERRYILFLRAEPGMPWRLVVPDVTLAEVANQEVRTVGESSGNAIQIWAKGGNVDEIRVQIQRLVPMSPSRP